MKLLRVLQYGAAAAAAVAILVALLAASLTEDQVVPMLPKKWQLGVQLMGWDGFRETVREAVKERVVGPKRTQARLAWRQLVRTLQDVDYSYVTAGNGHHKDEEVAEGFSFVMHLMSVGLDGFALNAHPHTPRFKSLFNYDKKWLVDNPDVYYMQANLDAARCYRVTGRKTREVYLSITVYQHPSPAGFAEKTISEAAFPMSTMSGTNLTFDADGKFAVRLCGSKVDSRPTDLAPHETWLWMPPPADAPLLGMVTVLTRHYFELPDKPAQLERLTMELDIELASPVHWDSAPSDESVAQRIRWMSNFIRDHSVSKKQQDENRLPDWYSLTPNVIGKPNYFRATAGTTEGVGAPDVAYSAGPWRLEADEALIIEGKFPPAAFANMLLMNKYLQTLGYQHGRRQSWNRRQLAAEGGETFAADGSMEYRVVLSGSDPGPGWNWMDTEGRPTGFLFSRIMLPYSDVAALPRPATKLVKVKDIHLHLMR